MTKFSLDAVLLGLLLLFFRGVWARKEARVFRIFGAMRVIRVLCFLCELGLCMVLRY